MGPKHGFGGLGRRVWGGARFQCISSLDLSIGHLNFPPRCPSKRPLRSEKHSIPAPFMCPRRSEPFRVASQTAQVNHHLQPATPEPPRGLCARPLLTELWHRVAPHGDSTRHSTRAGQTSPFPSSPGGPGQCRHRIASTRRQLVACSPWQQNVIGPPDDRSPNLLPSSHSRPPLRRLPAGIISAGKLGHQAQSR
jgi:hypothetical protein